MTRLARTFAALTRACLAVAAALLAAILMLVTASAVERYLFAAPFRFTEELTGLMQVAALFLALPAVALQGNHIRISVLADRFGKIWRRTFGVLAGFFTLAFCAAFGIEAAGQARFAWRLNIRSEISGIELAPWMAVLPVAMLLLAAAVISRWGRAARPDPGTGPAG